MNLYNIVFVLLFVLYLIYIIFLLYLFIFVCVIKFYLYKEVRKRNLLLRDRNKLLMFIINFNNIVIFIVIFDMYSI